MTRPQALIVEDAAEFRRLGQRVLEGEGFAVTAVESAEAALLRLERTTDDLYLVDVSLPGIDGFELCRQIRQQSDAYVVMVTGHADEAEKVVGLRLGADDYVTKPYSPLELAARVQAMRRRPRQSRRQDERHLGALTLDPAGREVRVAGRPVTLTRTEFDLLELLSSSPGRVFTRAQLMDRVWGYIEDDDHVVNVHMGNLRRKLAEHGVADAVITVRGVGYKSAPAH